tara:strand:+ start:22728 stop:25997 length:3270 start_codon:yes stop_codon:yes gene_type:complete
MKNVKIKKTSMKYFSKKTDYHSFLIEKTNDFQKIVYKTINSVYKYKTMDIIGASDINICLQNIENVQNNIINIQTILHSNNKVNYNDLFERVQKINNEFSSIFKCYGTESISDVINVCYGKEYLNKLNNDNNSLYNIIKTFIHPIKYKVLVWKDSHKISKNTNKKLMKNRIVEDYMIVDQAKTLDCFDLARTQQNFLTKVYGIKICFQNEDEKKTLILSGIIDDIGMQFINDKYIEEKINEIKSNKPDEKMYKNKSFDRFIESLTLKELLVYNNKDLYHRYSGYINQTKLIKQKTISQVIKEFVNSELYIQRNTIIQLLIKKDEPEFQYMAYLLYDLLSSENNNTIDTFEQTLLFDSLPWIIKKYFRIAMETTIKYTKNLSNFDTNRIPIEQQICLMKANDIVKEKAMNKLKEVKAKSEDSGSKAKNYLDGLLKIPFNIYKREPLLFFMKKTNEELNKLLNELKNIDTDLKIPIKSKYSSIELKKHLTYLNEEYIDEIKEKNIQLLKVLYTTGKRENLVINICFINTIVKKYGLKKSKLCHSGKKTDYMKKNIVIFIEKNKNNDKIMNELISKFQNKYNIPSINKYKQNFQEIYNLWSRIDIELECVKKTLDKSVHGHENAKRQIERIIGQWINGEQTGYCFGFEGPPGVGKTSLAKNGLANCLLDENGVSRPFSFIALGGSSNGSTLCGHNYTYVGSTWGRIVDILMDTKCMNPIIFIDELDKVSNTEHGKEIIGILTHLVDPTQNEQFQDKYFSGVDLNLSKVLFIFSYNNPSLIDKILLDRIHRVKFKSLSIEDKIIITKKHILPELYNKVGLSNILNLSDKIIKFIIDNYTQEAGVRKLKEILFEIISEINLKILKNNSDLIDIPVTITEEDIKTIYLKDRHMVRYKEIESTSQIGVINGLWANALGMGGIILIECVPMPSNNILDLKLTGMQGDVMKESMNVAKTLAWKLTDKKQQTKLIKEFKVTKQNGLHIHCPEGATPKDGPSAGTAITVCIYSYLNKKKINNLFAITGEIDLQGNVTAIGGLDLKILGGIRAGVKNFIFPVENEKDFNKFQNEYNDKTIFEGVSFYPVEKIQQVFELIFI